MKRFMLYIVFALLTLALVACGGDSPDNAQTPPPTSSEQAAANPTPTGQIARPLPTDANGQVLVARVNGQGITQAQFERALARSSQSSLAADPNALASTVLDAMIEQVLIAQAAQSLGVSVNEDDINADVAEMVSLAGSAEAWEKWKTDNLFTEEEYREAARAQLLTALVRDAIAQTQTPQTNTGNVRQVRARHILVSTEVEAQDVLRRLQAGENFETLAAALSKDVTTRDRGGDLGFFIRENLTTPELADLAYSLQPGETVGPVRTMLGYHIVQTIEFTEAPATVADSALQTETLFSEWLQAQRAAATIERYID